MEVLRYEIWLKSIFTAFIDNVIDIDIDLSKIKKRTNMLQTKLIFMLNVTAFCVFIDNVERLTPLENKPSPRTPALNVCLY